jgi:glycosyltransferase involved in cell wall biosynthesis
VGAAIYRAAPGRKQDQSVKGRTVIMAHEPAGRGQPAQPRGNAPRVLLFANTAWYLYNFRLSLAKALRAEGYEVLLASPADAYGQRIEAEGFRWVPVPMQRRSTHPIRELLLLRWLKRLMQRERIDLVHSFTLKCAIYGSLAARMAGVPARINAVAGLGYTFTRNSPRARVIRFVASTMMRMALAGPGLRMIVQNPDDLATFERMGVLDPKHFVLIPGSGVDCEKFKPDPNKQRGNPFKVLLPARILWDKGVAEFVEAARIVKARGGGVQFLLAGSPDLGNPTSVPEDTIRGWEREGLLTWLGHVEDMPALYCSVDAVALPSYREGLPKGLIEAAACGLPLIATDVPGCKEVVQHRVNGLLVADRQSEPIADAVMSLCCDVALANTLGSAAREGALNRFDERSVLSRSLLVYQALLPSSHEFRPRQAHAQPALRS